MSKVTVWFYDFPHICKLNDFQGSQTASLLSELATEFPVLFGIERLIKKYIRTGALGYTWTDKSSHSIKDLNIIQKTFQKFLDQVWIQNYVLKWAVAGTDVALWHTFHLCSFEFPRIQFILILLIWLFPIENHIQHYSCTAPCS